MAAVDMSLAVEGVFEGVRVMAVVRHDSDHLEVGLAGSEGTWTDPDGTVRVMTSATLHLFSEDDQPDGRERHNRNEQLLTAWRDEDTRSLDCNWPCPPLDCFCLMRPDRGSSTW
jgi:hypothetical protein